MNVMTDQQRQSVTDAALIELMTETGCWDHDIGADGMSMETYLRKCLRNEASFVLLPRMGLDFFREDFDVMEACQTYASSPGSNHSLKVLCSAYQQNESFRDTIILDVDKSNGAIVTQNTKTNTYTVAYCGTRWERYEGNDNAEGLLSQSSAAQRSAADYFDAMSSRFGEDANVVVTGHSKGGNKAQYVTMFANNRDVIDDCVALDGQGFSTQAMEAMQEHADYETQRNKITLVCGSDDYVHGLGERLAKREQTYYLEGSHRAADEGMDAFIRDHLAADLFVNNNGTYTCQLNAASEQGLQAKVVEMIYRRAADRLDPETFEYVARTAMGIATEGLDAGKVSQLIGYAGPIVREVLYSTPEGLAYLATLPTEFVSGETLVPHSWFSPGIYSFSPSQRGTILLLLMGGVILPVGSLFFEAAVGVWDLFRDGPSNKDSAIAIASENDCILVDTNALLNCASNLNGLQNRLSNLSERLETAFLAKKNQQAGAENFCPNPQEQQAWNKQNQIEQRQLLSAQSCLLGIGSKMKHAAKALTRMCDFLANAEKTAIKYSETGG